MIPSARIAGAIEVLADIETKRQPAAEALKDWGRMHRFAGAGDRAAIAGLVYDALRRRASSGYVMGEATPRAVMLGMLRLERGMDVDQIAALFDGARFAPPPLTEDERTRLAAASLQVNKTISAGEGVALHPFRGFQAGQAQHRGRQVDKTHEAFRHSSWPIILGRQVSPPLVRSVAIYSSSFEPSTAFHTLVMSSRLTKKSLVN